MTNGIRPGRVLALVAALVVALLALRAPLSFWSDGSREAAGILAGGTGTVLGLLFSVYSPTWKAALHGAAIVGVCAAVAALAPVLFDFLPLGRLEAEYGLWAAAVRALAEFCVAALLVTWVRSSSGGELSIGPTDTVSSAPGERRVAAIYRSRRERNLSGVCGGIAEAIGVDPGRLRWAAVLGAMLTTSAALLVYLLLALLVAEDPDHGEDSPHTERSLA